MLPQKVSNNSKLAVFLKKSSMFGVELNGFGMESPMGPHASKWEYIITLINRLDVRDVSDYKYLVQTCYTPFHGEKVGNQILLSKDYFVGEEKYIISAYSHPNQIFKSHHIYAFSFVSSCIEEAMSAIGYWSKEIIKYETKK